MEWMECEVSVLCGECRFGDEWDGVYRGGGGVC